MAGADAAVAPAPLNDAAFPWLAGALALATAPHVTHLPWWLTLLFVLAVGWRWRVAAHGAALPSRWLLTVVTLVAGGGVLLSYGTLFGRDAGVGLLTAMASLKLLESRSLRDGFVLVFLGYFLVMAYLLYSQSLPAAAYLLAAVAVLLAAQVTIHREHAALAAAALLRLAAKLLVQALPVMLILFVLFPRIPGPLWGLPKDAYSGLTGLSDHMTPGAISRLGKSAEVAFRVRFAGTPPAAEFLYWRGPVFWHYDGRTWRGAFEPLGEVFSYTGLGAAVDYTVILEPHGKRWLFALDLPAELPGNARVTASMELLRREPVTEVLRYPMRSYLRYRSDALSDRQRRAGLQLPPRGNPQARDLAGRWRQQHAGAAEIVNAALTLFREQPFHYTLAPPPLEGGDTVDEFIFVTRRGFCEHYAGSFVFLMRAAGVPARVVTGYQGGERNAIGDYFIVRQSDAHAWAEVWLDGRGWVRVDPTAAVAPERVELGIYAALSDPETLPLLSRRGWPWLRNIALGWDSVNNAWNEWVLAYGPERQRQFLSGLGFGPVDWRGMTAAMVVLLSAVALAFITIQLLRRRRGGDPVAGAWRRFCAKLARRGLQRHAHEGPLAYAERVAGQRPDLAARVRLISRLYARLRYGPDPRSDGVRRLQRLVRSFRA